MCSLEVKDGHFTHGRTDDDKGIAVLFDDRYSHKKYRELFPKNWNHAKHIGKGQYLQSFIYKFWEKEKNR